MNFIQRMLLMWVSKTKNERRIAKFGMFIATVLFVVGIGPIILKSSEAYERALLEVSTNQVVLSKFGENTEYSVSIFDGFSLSTKKAGFVIRVSNGDIYGKIYISMYKEAGIWKFEEINLITPGTEVISLYTVNKT